MGAPAVVSRRRRLFASAATIATAGGFAAIALEDLRWIEWKLLAFAGLVAAAGLGLSRRSVVTQVLSRGVTWLVLAPMLVATLFSFTSGRADWHALLLAAGPAAALALARPMLDTADAQAAFAPSGFRRWFLAWATATASVGVGASLLAAQSITLGWMASGAALGAFGAAMLASVVAVVRMRAWGVLLAAATSVASFATALVMHDAGGLALALASIPGLMLFAPVVAAQLRADGPSPARVRVDADLAADLAPRVRVAPRADDAVVEDDAAPAERARHASLVDERPTAHR